jgi:hypothetical protein
MPLLHIHLQDGFVGEPVVIRLAGRTLSEKSQVRTRPQIGLAEIIELDLPAGHHTLEVALPERGQTDTIPLDLDRELYLGITVDSEGSLQHRTSEGTFGYL